jgi:hypothetical protein
MKQNKMIHLHNPLLDKRKTNKKLIFIILKCLLGYVPGPFLRFWVPLIFVNFMKIYNVKEKLKIITSIVIIPMITFNLSNRF